MDFSDHQPSSGNIFDLLVGNSACKFATELVINYAASQLDSYYTSAY